MPDTFLALPADARREALEAASLADGRAAYLHEKDIWVVWALQTLFGSPVAPDLVFKGGTSLSKAYAAIERFSEDVDLTYDVRKIAPDVVNAAVPAALSKSAARRLSRDVRDDLLPRWVEETAAPILQARLEADGLDATLRREGCNLFIDYQAVTQPPDYLRASVKLEFGARATGQPAEVREVECYAAPALPDLIFPKASPQVMKVERTFWEKATAAHVFCRQARLRGDAIGYARHWHDLVRLDDKGFAEAALLNRALAQDVADHKSKFFLEKDEAGNLIDYHAAVSGGLQLAPEGRAYDVLAADYQQMIEAGLLMGDVESFEVLVKRCLEIQARANLATMQARG